MSQPTGRDLAILLPETMQQLLMRSEALGLLLLLLLAPIWAFAGLNTPAKPHWVERGGQRLGNNPLYSNAINLEQLLALAENTQGGVDEFIPQLPREFRGMDRYRAGGMSLAYFSHSQQPASFEKPRVILWGGAYLTLAFDGVTNTLEAHEYNPITKSWDYAQIDFSQKNRVQRNPEACLKCHGQPFRPNWRSYPVWEGFFGALHSRPIRAGSVEHTKWNQFLNGPQLPRYKALDFSDYQDYSHGNYNSALSNRFAEQNADRIAAEMIRALKKQPQFRAAAIAALLTSTDDGKLAWREDFQTAQQFKMADAFFAKLIPAEFRDDYQSSVMDLREDFINNLKAMRKKQLRRHTRLTGPLRVDPPIEFDEVHAKQTARILYVFGKLMKLDMQNWSLNFLDPAWTMSDGSHGTVAQVRENFFYQQWNDAKIRKIAKAKTAASVETYLEKMAKSCEHRLLP